MPMAGAEDLLDLLDARRQRDQVGRVAVRGQRVALEGDAGCGRESRPGPSTEPSSRNESAINGHGPQGLHAGVRADQQHVRAALREQADW